MSNQREILIKEKQTTNDIVRQILIKHKKCRSDYAQICSQFDKGETQDNWGLCKTLFDYCKANISYRVETKERQTVSSPKTIISQGEGDCKHYALFIAGVLDALKRQGHKIDWCFRFANYDLLSSSPEHVFVVVFDGNNEIWVDPVLRIFDYKKPFIFCIDEFVDSPVMSGVGSIGAVSPAMTQAQLNASGIYFALKVFANQNLTPQAATELISNPPFVFTLNGLRYNLPPENKVNGGAVPLMPPGLTVQYAPSFLGVPIPAYMPKPFVNTNNRLQIAPLQLSPTQPFSTDASVGNATNAMLLGNNKVLLNILMSVMGAMINSFSSHPYANGFNDLSHYIIDLRNKDNFLDPIDKKTIGGLVLQVAAKDVLPVAEAVVSIAIPVTAPFIALGAAALNPLAVKATSDKADQSQNIITSKTFVDAAGNIQSSDPTMQNVVPSSTGDLIPGVPNNYLIIGAAALALLLLSGSSKRKSKKKTK
jgi:hypothetical protein